MMKFTSAKMKARIMAGQMPEWMQRHPRKDYIVKAHLSTPPWVKVAHFKNLRDRAKELTRLHGHEYVLDHIVPITHSHVCGLTVPWNLEVVPKRVNGHKNNRWHPDQTVLNLQQVPEQLQLPLDILPQSGKM